MALVEREIATARGMETLTASEHNKVQPKNKFSDDRRRELFNEVVESAVLRTRGKIIREDRRYSRPGHFRLKGLLLLLLVAGAPFLLAAGLALLPDLINGRCGSVTPPSGAKSIALINDLGDNADTRFNSTISVIAKAAGYRFDYYGFAQAGVSFFLHLPQKGYSIVLLQTHGTAVSGAITTSDAYSTNQWIGHQLSGSVTRVAVNGTSHDYFGLTSRFLGQMCGDFHHALVIAMGCLGTQNPDLASGFVGKGAGAFVGWDNLITLDRTDAATAMLLQLMLEGKTLGSAVHDVMNMVGPDPIHGSQLLYYPGLASSYTLAS